MLERSAYVYILTNPAETVLYTGVTNNISRRLDEHRRGTVQSFSKKYYLQKLVYVEIFSDTRLALAREKQIKGGSRQKKIQVIESLNPEWKDLGSLI